MHPQGTYPRGIRKISVRARLLGSLPAEIKNIKGRVMPEKPQGFCFWHPRLFQKEKYGQRTIRTIM